MSISNREVFTKWVYDKKPKRVADYGGGFGSLARMIAKSCVDTEVEVIEPHPHDLAFEKAKCYKNLNYKKKLEGEYDIIIATDVFEHVQDPLGLAAETSKFLKKNGYYIIEDYKHPNYYQYNRDIDHIYADEFLNNIKDNKISISTIFTDQEQEDLIKSIKKIDFYRGNLQDSDICFIQKN